MSEATLYLIPTGLGSGAVAALLPQRTRDVIARLTYFVAENPKSARAFLKTIDYPHAMQDVQIETLDEHTPSSRIPVLLAPLEGGASCGVVSEAGCPGVADPGASLVRAAHAAGIRVVPLVGPSAILLALMASGLNGQRFSFRGYLPVERSARAAALRDLERASEREDATHIVIEAPYRNEQLFATIIDTCEADTLLCLATDLTLESESVVTRSVADWKKKVPALNRRPTVFLLYREARSSAQLQAARQKR